MRQRVTILLFLVIIVTPLILNTINSGEKKKIPSFESVQASRATSVPKTLLGSYRDAITYINKLNSYYDDQLSLRNEILPAFFFIKQDVFGTNPFPEKVIEGNNGWLFLGSSYSNVVAEAKGVSQFTTAEVEKVANNLQQMSQWLSQMNIEFIPAIAPEKLSVYGEQLAITRSDRLTKREQLVAYMTSRNMKIVDMSDEFKNYPGKQLYFKTDSHWNDVGALIGFSSVMRELQKFLRRDPSLFSDSSDTAPAMVSIYSGPKDLSLLLRRNEKEATDSMIITNPRASIVADKLIPPNNAFVDGHGYEVRYTNPTKKLKLLFFRDSFGAAPMRYFAESFRESVFVFSLFNPEIVVLEKPDVVILETTERNLELLLPE